MAGHQAKQMLEEVIEIFKEYMDMWYVDDLVNKIENLAKPMQMRIYKHPGIPFNRGDIINPFNLSRERRKDELKGTDGKAAIINLETSVRDMEEFRKSVSRAAINEYIFRYLPTYKYALLVAGGIHELAVDSLIRQNLYNQIYSYWLFVSSGRRTKIEPDEDDDDKHPYLIKLTTENIKAFLNYHHNNEPSFLQQNANLRLDPMTPDITSNNLLSSICLIARNRAWMKIKQLLYQSKAIDPKSVGIRKSSEFLDFETGIPGIRFAFLSIDGGLDLLSEFANLTAVYIGKQRELAENKNFSRFQFENKEGHFGEAVQAVKFKLREMGFPL